MSDIGIFFFVIWALSIIFVYKANKDIASPQIIYMVIIGLFFSDIFFSKYDYYLYAIYVVIILVVLISTAPYFFIHRKCSPYTDCRHICNLKDSIKGLHKPPLLLFWMVSLPAIFAMYYLINKFGGFEGYLAAAQFRTREFHGLGAIKTIISTYYVVNIFYFSYVINKSYIKKKRDYFLFGIHTIISWSLALISFSRGTLFMGLIFMGLIWHYSRSRIKPAIVISGIGAILVVVSLLGVVRETFNVNEEGFDLGIEGKEQIFKPTWKIYGTFPLESVVNSDHVDKKFGQTYITAVTNFIPRAFWPEKPDPGGVVFTKEYTENMYDEYSHFTTGIFPEAMINFGVWFGVLFGSLQLFLLNYFLTYFYVKNKFHMNSLVQTHRDIVIVILYSYTVVSATMLLTGEFTSMVVGWIIKVITTLSIYLLIRISHPRKNISQECRS